MNDILKFLAKFKEVEKDPRVAYVMEHLGVKRPAYQQYFIQAEGLVIKIKHFENLRKCLHFFFLVMLTPIAWVFFVFDARDIHSYAWPLMVTVALGFVSYCVCLIKFAEAYADDIKLFKSLCNDFTFIQEKKNALNDLDRILRQPAIIRHKDDLEALFEAEMKIIGVMVASHMDQVGEIAIRHTHNFVELRASAMRLGKIARRLSYPCPTLDEVISVMR